MAEIQFATTRGRIRLPVAELPGPSTLLDAVRHAGLPLGQSCRGEGVCRSCAVDILSGGEHLGADTALERRFGFEGSRRLACQASVPTTPDTIVVVGHRAWGRPPASDPAAPTSAPGVPSEP